MLAFDRKIAGLFSLPGAVGVLLSDVQLLVLQDVNSSIPIAWLFDNAHSIDEVYFIIFCLKN